MTDDALEDARHWLHAATPGPWRVQVNTEEANWFILTDTPTPVTGPGAIIARAEWPWDARFIAAAPDLIKALCDEVEHLRTQVEFLERILDQVTEANAHFADISEKQQREIARLKGAERGSQQ